MDNLLQIENLQVEFATYGGRVQAVRGVSFAIEPGECIAVVGESGCGKSVTAKSILRLLPEPQATIKEGSAIFFNGQNVLKYSEAQLQKLRGDDISMIFQDPMTSLNPTMTVGKQIGEVLIKHQKLSKEQAREKTIEFLSLVGIANPEKRFREYPDSLSGGMRQRVMIAIAMCCNPKLLIADEPTTALDVTIQAQILDLMRDLQQRFNTAIILITHDLGVVANMAQRVLVFYAGQIIEEGLSTDVFYRPRHPYTWGLIKSMPRLNSEHKEDLVSIEGVPPDLFAPPAGCAFAARCAYAMKLCVEYAPHHFAVGENHRAACWLNMAQTPADLRPSWISSAHVKVEDFSV
ncbi:MAG: ABC transporter ATP-binding protein [Clostridiales bacterium]|nr:ABC transporter ATP-binding protein [Clostridiales bacterium]